MLIFLRYKAFRISTNNAEDVFKISLNKKSLKILKNTFLYTDIPNLANTDSKKNFEKNFWSTNSREI